MFLGRELRKLFPRLTELVATVGHRRYMADGLITRHNADALNDPKFLSAYAKGRATGSWMQTEPRWRVYIACWAAACGARLPGDFVECGVNRGGTALAVMDYLEFNSLDKRFFLLDTFAGFPERFEAATANRGLYSECFADVVKTFAPYPGAKIIRGVVPDTLEAVDAEHIAYLSIDMNSAEPEVAAVRRLWPRMSIGAIVLLDDYAGGPAYQAQKQAFDAPAAELGFRILSLPTGQGLIAKA